MFSGFGSQPAFTSQPSQASSGSMFSSWLNPAATTQTQTQPQQSTFSFQQFANPTQQQLGTPQHFLFPTHVPLHTKPSNPQAPPGNAQWNTKFEDLHPNTQDNLKKIEERIRKTRTQLSDMGAHPRIANPQGFTDKREKVTSISKMISEIKELNAENQSVVSFLENERDRISDTCGSIATSYHKHQSSHQSHTQDGQSQALALSAAPTQSSTSSLSVFPQFNAQPTTSLSQPHAFGISDTHFPSLVHHSKFLIETTEKFFPRLQEAQRLLSRIETALQEESTEEDLSKAPVEEILSKFKNTLMNINYLINDRAAKIALLDDNVQVLRTRYLTMLQRRGDFSDPFIEKPSSSTFTSDSLPSMPQIPSSQTPPVLPQQQLPPSAFGSQSQPASSASGTTLFSSFLSSPLPTFTSSPATPGQPFPGMTSTAIPSATPSPASAPLFSSTPFASTAASGFPSFSPFSSASLSNPAATSPFGSSSSAFSGFSSSPAPFAPTTPFSSTAPSLSVPNLFSTPTTPFGASASTSGQTLSRPKPKTGSKKK